jgi:uncharacterized membrane protein YcaP (DUF421 family)
MYSFFDQWLGLSSEAHALSVMQVCLRAVLVFFILLAIVRVGKKRFLGQATAFDAILVIMIGSTASRAISGTAPFMASLAATATLVAVHWIVSLVTRKSMFLSSLVKGRSDLLVVDGEVLPEALKTAHMSRDDLDEDLRQQGVASPSQVNSARLERSGKLSVIKKT